MIVAEERTANLDVLVRSLAQSARVIGKRERAITGITIDSRGVAPGSLFVALRGERVDGHRFVAQAIAAGAAAVVIEERLDVPAEVTTVVVPDTARALSQLADAFYGFPSRALKVAGITGTNGKTTTTQMTAAILNAAGIATGTIGTIGASFAQQRWPLENTTPLAAQLQQLLEEMRERGAAGVVMEVSSHALALQRVEEVRFAVGALTNVTRDHLDFHKSFEAYAAAKHRLFDLARATVFNADDPHGAHWARECKERKPTLTYALESEADVRPSSLDLRASGSSFALSGEQFQVRIPGRFNVANALCAIAIARSLGVPDAQSAQGLAALERVPGRMEHLHSGGVDVVVDYAHTPDALEHALRALRETAPQRLVVVFGCGGDRDRGKRCEMAAAAARYADFVYVTSDNPRSEDPQAIIAEILPGLGGAPHAVEPDRRRAIEAAIAGARSRDVILVAGKGHENYQIIGTQVLPFDDRVIAQEALARRGDGTC